MEAEDLEKINVQQEEQEDLDPAHNSNQASNENQVFDTEFFLLIIILLIFFQRPDIFSEKLQLVTNQVQTVKNYLETADATLQALDQASQIPNQKLN